MKPQTMAPLLPNAPFKTGRMSLSLFETIDRADAKSRDQQTKFVGISALSTVVRVGAQVALQQSPILRTNIMILPCY